MQAAFMTLMECILVVTYVKSLKMGKHVFAKKGKRVMQITIKEKKQPNPIFLSF